MLIMFKVRGQVEKCLEPVRLCNYACEIKNEMCQGNLSVNFFIMMFWKFGYNSVFVSFCLVCKPVMAELEEKCYSNLLTVQMRPNLYKL